MAVAPVSGRRLDRVTDRVTEVEDRAVPAVALVGRDHVDLRQRAGEHDVRGSAGSSEAQPSNSIPQRAARDQGRLQHLDEAGRELLGGQRGERRGSASTADGMWYAPT